jgi:hypothetical protein
MSPWYNTYLGIEVHRYRVHPKRRSHCEHNSSLNASKGKMKKFRRHDNLLREFANAFATSKWIRIPGRPFP